MKETKDLKLSILIKSVAIIASIYGMVRLYIGPRSFTYFTNLSNIWIDCILLVFLIMDVKCLRQNKGREHRANWLYIIKYMLTISITLTFMVFLFILAPTMKEGFFLAYFENGAASFCVHFLTPVLAIIDFFLFDYPYESHKKHVLYSTVPPLIYVTCVVIAGYCGMRWGEDNAMWAPYNFVNFGAPTGWFGFDLSQVGPDSLGIGVAYMVVALVLIFLVFGQLYLNFLNYRKKKRK